MLRGACGDGLCAGTELKYSPCAGAAWGHGGGRNIVPVPATTVPGFLSPSPLQILRRYDVVLVQEVRDSDLSAVTELLEQLNRYEWGWGSGAEATGVKMLALRRENEAA